MHISSVLGFFLFSLQTALATDCTAESFYKILPSNASINLLADIKEGGSFGDSRDLDFPGNATNLPALCAISIQIHDSDADTSYSFGLFLPDEWNNRLVGTGNTGFGGGINWPYMGVLSHYGVVAFSTDTGHDSNPNSAGWALNNPVGITNWGYRAMHESLVMAKSVVHKYYSDKISYSYYTACSGGGRQGLKEAQEYPEDFDGYAVGAPPWLLTHLHPWTAYVGIVNLEADDEVHISDDVLGNLTKPMIEICDPQDGVTDNIVQTPWSCDFNSSSLLCQNDTQTNCLTPEQQPLFDTMWSDWVDSTSTNGSIIAPTFMLGGSMSGLGSTDADGAPSQFGTYYVENFIINSTTWNWTTVSPEYTTELGDSFDPGSANADNFDLSPFYKRGGKMLHYHGLADPLIPPGWSVAYYDRVKSHFSQFSPSANISDFYRFYPVPGLYHCHGSGTAPNFFAGGGQTVDNDTWTHSVPGYMDSSHDIILAIMDWVENGTEPSLIATKWHNNQPGDGVYRQMPLCAWPQVARLKDHGDYRVADDWSCVTDEDTANLEIPYIQIREQGSVVANSSVPTSNSSDSSSTTSSSPLNTATATSGATVVGRDGGLVVGLGLGIIMTMFLILSL